MRDEKFGLKNRIISRRVISRRVISRRVISRDDCSHFTLIYCNYINYIKGTGGIWGPDHGNGVRVHKLYREVGRRST